MVIDVARAHIWDISSVAALDMAVLKFRRFGATVEIDYERNYPVMANHDRETEFAAEAARKVSGQCDEAPLIMGGEDFAYLLNARPGAYILVGNGDGPAVHHPEYNFNDDAIPAGCSWFVEVVESRLAAS